MKPQQSTTDIIFWFALVCLIIAATISMCGCGTSKKCTEPIGPYHIKDANTH